MPRNKHLMELFTKLFNTPHMITAAKFDVISAVLADKIGVTVNSVQPPAAYSADEEEDGYLRDSAASSAKMVGPMLVANGVASIPVDGTLVKSARGLHPDSGMVGYNQIAAMAELADKDDSVGEIAMLLNTHGGEVDGVFELADFISNGVRKPTTAIVSSNALSAGYLLASSADRIVSSKMSRVGSIGVIMAIRDETEAMNKAGIKYDYIYAGKYKSQGAPGVGIAPEMREHLQKQVDGIYEEFVSLVSEARGIDAEKVRATNALTYMAQDAIELSLIDEIANTRDAISAIETRASKNTVSMYGAQKRSMKMEHLKVIAGMVGVDCSGMETPEALLTAITAKLGEMKAVEDAAVEMSAFLADMECGTVADARAKVASMVDRAKLTELQDELTASRVERMLMEGKISGKLSDADCSEDGWARKSASESPDIFASVLDNLPVRYSTGEALKAFTAGFKTSSSATNGLKNEDEKNTGKASASGKTIIESGGKRYKFGKTAVEEGYDDSDVPNMRDLIGRYGADSLIEEGLIEPVE